MSSCQWTWRDPDAPRMSPRRPRSPHAGADGPARPRRAPREPTGAPPGRTVRAPAHTRTSRRAALPASAPQAPRKRPDRGRAPTPPGGNAMNHPAPIAPSPAAPAARATRAASADRSRNIAPDTRGENYWDLDPSLRSLLPLYMDPALLAHLTPHMAELGELAGGRLGALADTCERHEPVLHRRDRYGRDEEWLEFHPAYREMESIAFGRFGMHAMTNRAGVLGWPDKMPPIAKYVFHYLFSQ